MSNNKATACLGGVWRVVVKTYLAQLWLLMRKDALLAIKAWKSTVLQLLAPVGFMLMLYLCSLVVINTDDVQPPIKPLAISFPPCLAEDRKPCITIVYSFEHPNISLPFTLPLNETDADFVMGLVADAADLEMGVDVVKFNSTKAMADHIVAHPNHTLSGVTFYQYDTLVSATRRYLSIDNSTTPLPYSLWYNATATDEGDMPRTMIFDSLDSLLEGAISHFLVDGYSTTSASLSGAISEYHKKYPVIYRIVTIDAVKFIGPTLFFCAIAFNLMIFMYNIVFEKEQLLRQSMLRVGMKESMYWLSQFIYNIVFVFLLSLIIIASGAAFQFRFFLKANFFVVFLNFFIFGVAMTPLAILITMLVKTTRSAINAGMALFILGALAQIIFSISYVLQYLYAPDTSTAYVRLLQLWAPFNFAKVLANIADKTPQKDTGSFAWSDLYARDKVISTTVWELPKPVDSWGFQFMDFCIYLIIALILYNVLPSEGGWLYNKISRLMSLKARRQAKQRSAAEGTYGESAACAGVELQTRVADEATATGSSSNNNNALDSDVMEDEARANQDPITDPIVIRDLKKIYRKFPFGISSKSDVAAVKGISLTVHEGEVYCLLGHNGAGKSTTLSMLVGEFPPSSGDAFIYGHSVLTDLDEVRNCVGICPQHDCLWPELTAREHLRIFAELKGVPSSKMQEEMDARLSDVNLLDVGNWRSKSFSGGMKRRLSVAISCIGNPRLILLDEPTTGLDPLSRRHLWAAIQRLKKGRVVVLTTHAMEEADALGDRIAIMAGGKIQCLGSPLHLKNKHGVGYVLNISSPEARVDEAKRCIEQLIPDAPLLASTSGNLKYGIPMNKLNELVQFLQRVEAQKAAQNEVHVIAAGSTPPPDSQQQSQQQQSSRPAGSPISDWGVSQTTLEEVFIRFGNHK